VTQHPWELKAKTKTRKYIEMPTLVTPQTNNKII